MEIAVVAGEASGDRHAAELVKALQQDAVLKEVLGADEPLSFWGIGSSAMQAAGVRLVHDSRSWGAIGVVEALTKVPRVIPAKLHFQAKLEKNPPKALILVDFGAFNVSLAKWAKSRNLCPIFYYMPPGSWRRSPNLKRLAGLAKLTDAIVTPFAWSEDHLRQAGANAFFVGHPLLDLVGPTMDAAEFDTQMGLDASRIVITLLPGSRTHEVENLLPVMFGAAGEIASRIPGTQFLVAMSPNLDRAFVENLLRKQQQQGGPAKLLKVIEQASGTLLKAASAAMILPQVGQTPVLATNAGTLVDKIEQQTAHQRSRPKGVPVDAPVALVQGLTYDAMNRADLVIAASGTATLEAAILGKPMIIAYRGSWLMNCEYQLRKKSLDVEFFGLPNILAGWKVCPELLQQQATPDAIAEHALEMLLEPDRLFRAQSDLRRIISENLGEVGGSERAARIFAEYLVKGDRNN